MRKYILVLGAVLVVPAFAHASVLINEIAWMGTAVNANAEWLELYNSGNSSIDLTGWKLVAASGSPNITLSGSIAANGYFLLERTSDDSVPGVPADQIYTGALTNSGTILTLSDASNNTVDTVVGGTNWASVGGDNTTKDTAQRVGTGWTTATPTPRAANGVTGSSSSTSTTTASTTTSTSSSASTYTPPPSNISIDITGDATAVLQVPVHFSAQVKNKSGTADPNAQISWSFGDGSSAIGNAADKTFRYAGTYAVIARAKDGSATAYDELLVVATSSAIQITSVTGDGITLANEDANRLDLSGWRLSASTGIFRMPEGAVLLPHASMFFPNEITNLPIALDATLAYPNGMIAARYTPHEPVPAAQLSEPVASSTLLQAPEPTRFEPPAPSTSVIAPANVPEPVDAPAATANTAAVGAALPETGKSIIRSPWMLGFLGFLGVSAGVLMIL